MSANRKRKPKLPTWAHQPALYAVKAFVELINAVGLEDAVPAMRSMGAAFAKLPFNRKRIERAASNLAWCFPHMSEPQRIDLAIESYRHLFRLVAEVAVAPRALNLDTWPDHIALTDYTPVTDRLDRKQPTLLITGHYGNWELLGHAIALLGYPMYALYRPLDMKPLDDYLRDVRADCGIKIIDKFGATHLLPPLIDAGEPVAFVADQNAGDRGLFVPFFDRLASAYKSIGVLAMRHNANIAVGAAHRIGENLKYRVDIVDIFGPDDWNTHPDPLFYITARYRYAIETGVSRAPEQYLWIHRYWKSRPRHERAGQPFPSRLREKIEALPWMTEERIKRIVERSAADAATFAEEFPDRVIR